MLPTFQGYCSFLLGVPKVLLNPLFESAGRLGSPHFWENKRRQIEHHKSSHMESMPSRVFDLRLKGEMVAVCGDPFKFYIQQ